VSRRKRKSFGAPPAWHRKEAVRLGKSMRSAIRVFNKALKRNDCPTAFAYLLTVESLGSALYREREGEHGGKRIAANAASYGAGHRGTRPTRYKMERRFAARCLR